ncbi:hypothetical protein T265_02534 [Opisthorchis viverrini]|uniref:Uncharacterized protein n=1 Tax=Opisthorchis viverrini TaxID=6198 RepID=A0A074ZVT9_OPIVI|nr:hypothetical protein T265_02534 [Opisthorchis viverrini]KER31216.1 hypothetical protein T265_02534 [Opisthorchis viverrini]
MHYSVITFGHFIQLTSLENLALMSMRSMEAPGDSGSPKAGNFSMHSMEAPGDSDSPKAASFEIQLFWFLLARESGGFRRRYYGAFRKK